MVYFVVVKKTGIALTVLVVLSVRVSLTCGLDGACPYRQWALGSTGGHTRAGKLSYVWMIIIVS